MKKIPFSPPSITEEDIQAVSEALQSGWITTGPKTKAFENELASYCNAPRAVALNSATAAMELTLHLLGIGPGDEVITSAYTYTASASVIHHVGAQIVLVDTLEGSPFMDLEKLEEAVTEKTKAIICVDLGGVMCDYEGIYQVIEKKKDLFKSHNELQKNFSRIILIADGAHSIGATYKGQKCGSVADFTCFSFHAVKNLTTAEGGAVLWKEREGMDNDEIYRTFMHLCLHGQTKDALSKEKLGGWEYDIVAPYYKCNMTDINASLGLSQLKRYDSILQLRRELIETYDRILSPRGVIGLDHYGEDHSSSGHLYICRIPGIGEKGRNQLIERMAQRGIATNVHYKPLPMLSAYKNLGFRLEDYPKAYAFYEDEITLPLNNLMTLEDAEYVANILLEEIEER